MASAARFVNESNKKAPANDIIPDSVAAGQLVLDDLPHNMV